MSIVNNSNFKMPSLNGLVDINVDIVSSTNISSDLISSKNVDTQTLYVNGVDLGTQVNINAQKLTAITYTATPTPKTNVSSNLAVSGQLNVDGTQCPKSVGRRWSCVGEGKYTIIKENMRGEYSVIPWDRRFRSELKLFKIKNIASNHMIWNIDCKYLSRTIFDTFDL